MVPNSAYLESGVHDRSSTLLLVEKIPALLFVSMRPAIISLPNNYDLALDHFKSGEIKFSPDPSYALQYADLIDDF